jgi:hypothetical protein
VLVVAVRPLLEVRRHRPVRPQGRTGLAQLPAVQGVGPPAADRALVVELGHVAASGRVVSRPVTHPDWCAGGHHCRAPLGEHRSEPMTFRASYGAQVVTMIRDGRNQEWAEIRAVVRLERGGGLVRDDARRLVLGVDLIIRDVLAGRLRRVKQAYKRLTGTTVR